MYLASDATESM